MGHKPYLEKACTVEPPSILSNNLSYYFLGMCIGIVALFICTRKIENKKYILTAALIGSALPPIISKVITLNSCALCVIFGVSGFFNGFLFVYSIMWIEQFGKQNKKILFLSLIPLIIGAGIFVAYNYQEHIPCIQIGVLCVAIIYVLFADNNNFNSKFYYLNQEVNIIISKPWKIKKIMNMQENPYLSLMSPKKIKKLQYLIKYIYLELFHSEFYSFAGLVDWAS
jgi:uncharacterized membrane protein